MIETRQKQEPARDRRSKMLKGEKPAVWRPQPTGLSRDEIRRIVLEALG